MSADWLTVFKTHDATCLSPDISHQAVRTEAPSYSRDKNLIEITWAYNGMLICVGRDSMSLNFGRSRFSGKLTGQLFDVLSNAAASINVAHYKCTDYYIISIVYTRSSAIAERPLDAFCH